MCVHYHHDPCAPDRGSAPPTQPAAPCSQDPLRDGLSAPDDKPSEGE